MNKFLTVICFGLAAAGLWADNAAVQATSERRESSKTTGMSGQSAEELKASKIPPHLRDKPVDKIPFPVPASSFKENPNPRVVIVGPMPDALRPMGPPKPEPTDKGKPVATVDLPARKVVEIPEATDKTASANASSESVTTNPFLDWIRTNKDAVEVARAQREGYDQKILKDKMMKDAAGADLFLNIRFPYLGNQDAPPSGGAVIYSLPQR
jgi:hypothetical protein